jgi:hypothetical protein
MLKKLPKLIPILLSLMLGACVTNPDGSDTITLGSTKITIPPSDVQAANNIFAGALQAAQTGAENLIAGSANAKQVAGSELWSLVTTLQANIGQVVPPTVLSSSSSITQLGNTASQVLSSTVVTQALVNKISAQAAKLVPATSP